MDGIIDISIARTPLRLDDVDYKILSSEPMIAVSSKDMLPEKNGSLKLSDLLNIPLIIYRRYEALIMDAFHSRGMEPDLFCVCDDPRGAMLWAKEGLATAIFPQSMSSLCQGLRIQPLAESDLETQIFVNNRQLRIQICCLMQTAFYLILFESCFFKNLRIRKKINLCSGLFCLSDHRKQTIHWKGKADKFRVYCIDR